VTVEDLIDADKQNCISSITDIDKQWEYYK